MINNSTYLSDQQEFRLGFLMKISLVITLSSFIMGYQIGIINTTEKQLSNYHEWKKNSWIYVTLASAALCLGAAFGALVSGKYSNYFGRRKGIIINNFLVIIISGLVIDKKTAIPNDATFIVLRFLMGICLGISSAISPIFINEISPQRIKNWLGLFIQFMIALGILISFITGYVSYFYLDSYWSWAFPYLFPVSFSFIQIYLFLYKFQHDTPKWLLINSRQNEVEIVLRKIYTSCAWQIKLIDLEEDKTSMKSVAEALPGILTKSYTRQLCLAYILCILQQLTGINVIIFYSREIFKKYDETLYLSYIMTIVIGLINFISVLPCFSLVKIVGIKNMLLQGFAGLFVCYTSLVVIGYIDKNIFRYWFEMGIIFVSIGFYETSLGSLVWLYITEILSFEWIGSAISVQWVFSAAISLIYPVLFEFSIVNDMLILYILFAVFCFCGFVIVYVFTVDARYITIQEIARRISDKDSLIE